jgi:hypothetical protein
MTTKKRLPLADWIEANIIAIAESTRKLVGNLFELEGFPMPASPESNTTRPSPFFAFDQRRRSSSSSSSRPTRDRPFQKRHRSSATEVTPSAAAPLLQLK